MYLSESLRGDEVTAEKCLPERRRRNLVFYFFVYVGTSVWQEVRPDFPHDNLIEQNLFYKIGDVVQGCTEWLELSGNWVP